MSGWSVTVSVASFSEMAAVKRLPFFRKDVIFTLSDAGIIGLFFVVATIEPLEPFSMDDNIKHRMEIAKNAKRVLVKLGTRLLTGGFEVIPEVVASVADLMRNGREVMLVSSGAVGLGMETIGAKKRPAKLSQAQALAALGQSKLMSFYERECAKHGFHAAQILLTAEDLRDRKRHLNILNCLDALWKQGNLPVVNENDSVSVDEIRLGDNDTLAAMLAVMARADLTIILTTVDGLKRREEDAALGDRIPLVESVSQEIRNLASGSDDTSLSIGGMASKIAAAEMVAKAGEAMIIADGRDKRVLERVFNGEDVGTLFIPSSDRHMRSRQRWFDFFSKSKGKLFVDEGAADALITKGRSLLPSGVTGVEGAFDRGDTVEIVSADGAVIAKGIANFRAEDLAKIAGMKSREAREILGAAIDDEVVHRNNMVVAHR